MSGPKLIELRRMRAAAERQRNHDRCAAFGSEYGRLFAEFQDWGKRLAQLGLPAGEPAELPERLGIRMAELLRVESHHEAARLFGEAVAALRQLVENRRGRFQVRLATLQNRHAQWLRDCATLAAERSRLSERSQSGIPAGWPEAERQRLQNLLAPVLAPAPATVAAAFPESPETIAAMEQAAAATEASLTALRSSEQRFETELNATRVRRLTGTLDAAAPASPSLAEVLQRFTPSPRPAPVADHTSLELDRLLSELAAMSDDGWVAGARRKAEEVRGERDPARRRLLAESLLLEGGARVKDLRESARRREEAQRWIDGAAHLRDAAVDVVLAELRQRLETGLLADLEPVRLRLQAAVAAAEARREREYKRRALIDSLKELGYETREGLETALVKEGRLVLQRPGETEYAVELVADAELVRLQTALVRYADTADLTEQQKRRDREREESWCADHARLREKMAAHGLETPFKMQLKAGEHPVKVIVDEARNEASRDRPEKKDLRRET